MKGNLSRSGGQVIPVTPWPDGKGHDDPDPDTLARIDQTDEDELLLVIGKGRWYFSLEEFQRALTLAVDDWRRRKEER